MIFRGYGTAKMAKKRQAWEQMRLQGKRSYLLRRGMVRWGGFMFLFSNCMDLLAHHNRLDWSHVVVGAIVWPLTGYVWALAMWIMNERFFFGRPKKQPANHESQPEPTEPK